MKCTFWVKIGYSTHNNRCVWEKKLPCFLYLIQIFALHCRRTPLHYYHRRLPLAAYVVLIGQSVTERKPAGYRERARAAPSKLRRSVAGRLAARGEVLLHYRVPLGLHRYGVLLPPLRMPPPQAAEAAGFLSFSYPAPCERKAPSR